MLTSQRQTYYRRGEPPDSQRKEERSLATVLKMLLAHDILYMEGYRCLPNGELVVQLKPSITDRKQEVVTYRGNPDEVELLVRVVQLSTEYRQYSRDQLVGEMVTPEGAPVISLRPVAKITSIANHFSSAPWRQLAVLVALGLPCYCEVLKRYATFDQLDDFLAVATLAYETNQSIDQVEAQLA